MVAARRRFEARPVTGRLLLASLLLLAATLPLSEPKAVGLEEAVHIPHLGEEGRRAFARFLFAADHRAFAIAPGGSWAWQGEETSAKQAGEKALQACEARSGGRCALYAVDDAVVFDRNAWPSLWGPYGSRSDAAQAVTGTAVGQRFPDLLVRTPKGRPTALSAFRGQVVLLHFWGSWCAPCGREMPDLARLHRSLGERGDIRVVLLQVREPYDTSRRWLERLGLSLPLYDSGAGTGTRLPLAGGGGIEDREVAALFPSTYVIDGNGIVLYGRRGAARDWLEYLPFLEHAARHTARGGLAVRGEPAGEG